MLRGKPPEEATAENSAENGAEEAVILAASLVL